METSLPMPEDGDQPQYVTSATPYSIYSPQSVEYSGFASMGVPFYTPQDQFHMSPSGAQFVSSMQMPSYPADLNPMMANVAVNYGTAAAGRYRSIMMDKLTESGYKDNLYRLFDVDTSYVLKKLLLLTVPFHFKAITGRQSMSEQGSNGDSSPRSNPLNPDIYIPVMSWVTFVLLCGISLGLSGKFSPELLGMLATKMLVLLGLEILFIVAYLYLCDIEIGLGKLDLLAYTGYKYWMCIYCGLCKLLFSEFVNLCCYLYMAASLMFFLARTLKVSILSGGEAGQPSVYTELSGSRARLYLLVSIIIIQVSVLYLLTLLI